MRANSTPAALPAPARAAGFTLLEVLIALAVLSVCLLAIYQGYSTVLAISASTRKLWKAMEYSHNELARWERMYPAPEVSVNQGNFPPDDPMAGYSWKREITDLEPLPTVRVRRVRLDLFWTLGSAQQTYRSSLYVLPTDQSAQASQPAPSASGTPPPPGAGAPARAAPR
jgi:prepilin-type N-terminal cleavage/methylation domain-containing protein